MSEAVIPIKIQCGCGQKYAFEIEPVNGLMPTAVACPGCGTDGTPAANGIIAQTLAVSQATPATSAPLPPKLRISSAPPHVAPSAPPPLAQAPPPMPPPLRSAATPKARAKSAGEFSLIRGVMGALIGAAVGIGAMYGFYAFVGFRFPLLGVGIGVLTGLGAKVLARGTDNSLGGICAVIALVSVVGALYLMYGGFPIVSIISVLISASMAFRVASG